MAVHQPFLSQFPFGITVNSYGNEQIYFSLPTPKWQQYTMHSYSKEQKKVLHDKTFHFRL